MQKLKNRKNNSKDMNKTAGFPIFFLIIFLGYLGEFRRLFIDFIGYFIGLISKIKQDFRRSLGIFLVM